MALSSMLASPRLQLYCTGKYLRPAFSASVANEASMFQCMTALAPAEAIA